MMHLVFTPDRDERGNDFGGAFKPESQRYAAWYESRGDEVRTVRVDVSRSPAERAAVVSRAVLTSPVGIDRLALFCHGWETGVQLGLRSATDEQRRALASLSASIASHSTPDLKVALYACLAGKGGPGSFAHTLFVKLREAGRANVTVFAHTDAGHCTRNADCIIFSPQTPDGEAIFARGMAAYKRFDAMLDAKSDIRWRAPYMTVEGIRSEIGA